MTGPLMTSTEPATWTSLRRPTDVAAAIVDLYRRHGDERYAATVSHTEHALQTGALAMVAGAPAHLIVAAFTHDIGRVLAAAGPDRRTDRDDRHHELGARHLARWFDLDVVEPVRLHVAAKRYLCATDATYHEGLSTMAAHALKRQGGPMTSGECLAFERLAASDDALRVRAWDDRAVTPRAPTPPLEAFADVMIEVLG